MPSKPCITCERSIPIFATRRCHKCFSVWGAENGVPAEHMPKPCPVEGCADYVVKRGYCDRHYRRFIDHGTTDKLRAVNETRLHPEYKNWLFMKRQGRLCPEWQAFHVYVQAVGDRPSPRHWAARPDETRLFGPDNFVWRAPLLDAEHTLLTMEGRRAYQRAKRGLQPRYWVGNNLKRFFGLTKEQYDDMLAAQGGTCALCPKTSDMTDGKTRLLSVDHNHTTAEIRGLLCHSCNVGLGHFRDSPEALRRAADYLERHGSGLFAPKVGDAVTDDRRRSAFTLRADSVCSEAGCDGVVKARGLCAAHYARLMRNGSTNRKRVRQACTIADCGKISVARGLCRNHYQAAYTRDFLPEAPPTDPKCSFEGCSRRRVAQGLCMTHYKRMKRHGSADIVHNTRGTLVADAEKRADHERL